MSVIYKKVIVLVVSFFCCASPITSAQFSNYPVSSIYTSANRPKPTTLTPGTLDRTFGSGGTVTKNMPGTTLNGANDVAIDRFGRIVVAGETTVGEESRFALARFMPDGSLDLSFGSGGYVNADITTGNALDNYANAIAIDSEGRILAAGVYNSDPAIVRYLENGSVDTTFGTAGLTSTSIANSINYIQDIALDSTGRIIAIGYSDTNANDILVMCYQKDGGLDASFGTSGYTILEVGSVETTYGLALDASDNIIVAGTRDDDVLVAKLTSAGVLDTTFGTNGYFTFSTTNPGEVLYSVKIDAQGRIVVSGSSNDTTTIPDAYGFFVMRLLPTGDLDTTFNSVGYAVYSFTGFEEVNKSVLAIDPLGRLIVMGSQWYPHTWGDTYVFSVLRILSNGDVDSTFGNSGIPGLSFYLSADNTIDSFVHAGVLDAQGRIVMVGYAGNDFYLARFTSDYTFDYYKNQFATQSLGLLG